MANKWEQQMNAANGWANESDNCWGGGKVKNPGSRSLEGEERQTRARVAAGLANTCLISSFQLFFNFGPAVFFEILEIRLDSSAAQKILLQPNKTSSACGSRCPRARTWVTSMLMALERWSPAKHFRTDAIGNTLWALLFLLLLSLSLSLLLSKRAVVTDCIEFYRVLSSWLRWSSWIRQNKLHYTDCSNCVITMQRVASVAAPFTQNACQQTDAFWLLLFSLCAAFWPRPSFERI